MMEINTSKTANSLTQLQASPRRYSEWRRFRRVFFSRWVVILGLFILVVLAILAVFAAPIAPYDPYKPSLRNALAQPGENHWLGTDSLGRDTLTRIIYGARTSLIVGFIAIGIAAAIGLTLGLLGGYFEGWVGTVVMRWIDAQMAIPTILLALAISALLGGGIKNVVIALGVGMIPPYARLMYGQVLTIKENDYVMAARSLRASNARIMLHHIAPNAFPPLIVLMTMQLGQAILGEAGLSFLGVGISPPQASWGAMVSEGYKYLLSNPVLSFAPGIAIILVVFAFNIVGDGLRDALDPRLRGTL